MAFQKYIAPIQYSDKGYSTKDRWVSYSWQTKLVKSVAPQGRVLEIGVGNGVVASFLSGTHTVETVDINAELRPTHVGSVERLDFLQPESFDAVLCAEVLEHLPYAQFDSCLKELQRVSKNFIILSLPYWGNTFGIRLRMPVLGTRTLKWKLTGYKPHTFNGQHYWEIGKRGYPVWKIKQAIRRAGFEINKSFWDLDDAYHYYFVLSKRHAE
jgi:SAM-dependent methyltransferase